MNKFFAVGLTLLVVIFCYLGLLVLMPAVSDITSEAAIQMDASANMSNFPATKETTQSASYWLWAVPGVGGIISVAVILRKGERN